jgi:hypothetical protein
MVNTDGRIRITNNSNPNGLEPFLGMGNGHNDMVGFEVRVEYRDGTAEVVLNLSLTDMIKLQREIAQALEFAMLGHG